MPVSLQAMFMNYWSLLAVVGGQIGAKTVGLLGRRRFTTLTNILTAVGFYLVSIPKVWASWFGYFVMLPGFNANHCIGMKAYATDLAVAHGIGRGEFAASIALLRGLSVVVAPTIYAWLFGQQMRQGQNPRKAWWSVIVLGAILPEICHQMLTDDDLDSKKILEKRKKEKEEQTIATGHNTRD